MLPTYIRNPRLDTFTRQYIETAFWSSDESGGDPLDKNYGIEDLAPETLTRMVADAKNFQALHDEDIASSTGDWGLAGRDFWLTRNRHGAGFWDGGWPEPQASRLTDAANSFGEYYLYVGDDGLIYGI